LAFSSPNPELFFTLSDFHCYLNFKHQKLLLSCVAGYIFLSAVLSGFFTAFTVLKLNEILKPEGGKSRNFRIQGDTVTRASALGAICGRRTIF
jgi:hypothetical protein